MVDGREDYFSEHFFLILKFETWKITTIPTHHRYLLFQTWSVLHLSLACTRSASLLLFNPTVLADGYYYFGPLYRSLQTSAFKWAHSTGEVTDAEVWWHHAPHAALLPVTAGSPRAALPSAPREATQHGAAFRRGVFRYCCQSLPLAGTACQ